MSPYKTDIVLMTLVSDFSKKQNAKLLKNTVSNACYKYNNINIIDVLILELVLEFYC